MNKKQKYHQSVVSGKSNAVKVVNRDLNLALRIWKGNLKSSEILTELKERREYIKPSIIKRQQKAKAVFIQRLRSIDEQY
jgi:ribosomal protein S21